MTAKNDLTVLTSFLVNRLRVKTVWRYLYPDFRGFIFLHTFSFLWCPFWGHHRNYYCLSETASLDEVDNLVYVNLTNLLGFSLNHNPD